MRPVPPCLASEAANEGDRDANADVGGVDTVAAPALTPS